MNLDCSSEFRMPFIIPYLQLNTSGISLPQIVDACEGTFIKGKVVSQFEDAFKSLLGSSHCISTGSGTDALFIALKCLGIQPGDEVLTPALSWISSAETISLCHAKPVFVDVEEKTYTIDPTKIEACITSKTKAVIAVHLYGQAADLTAIKKICERHNLFLIEDCAQAHLTTWNNQYVGTVGDVGAFSFYPTKNLGAWGDSGCVVTNHAALAEKMRRFANHGALQKEDHLIEGTNSRMDSLQAAVLLQKLPALQTGNDKRAKNANRYTQHLKGLGDIKTPVENVYSNHTYHIYAIRSRKRNELQQYLCDQGIQTLIHYPTALPFLPAYQHLNHQLADFPVAAVLQHELLSLPIHPELTEDQIDYISNHVVKFFVGSPEA